MNRLIPLSDIIAHQRQQLAEAERLYDAAAKAGNYAARQYAGKRINRIRTALVLHGAMESIHESADEEERSVEREDAE